MKTPFSSSTFQKTWREHFIPRKDVFSFEFINGINFYKHNFFCFVNVGKNLTKGNSYKINNAIDYKKNTLVIYDVLPHQNIEQEQLPKNIGVLKSIQYPGFLIELNKFKNIDEYLLKTLSKRTRSKILKCNKRLDKCFNITSKFLLGDIDRDEYNEVFENFMFLLQKRYSEKKIYYNNMQPKEWNFYKDVAYPLILNKKASLFVIYDNKKPISITYNYHSEDSLINAITVFDINYSKFNIGYINNLKLLNWCFDNGLKTFDFSKGYFDYKEKMSTLKYDFEYHIVYDKKSILSKSVAFTNHYLFELKTYLRKKNINTKFHKLTYRFNNKPQSKPNYEFDVTKLNELPHKNNLVKIDVFTEHKYSFLTKPLYDFQFLVVKPYEEIDIYKVKNNETAFVISSDSLIQQVLLKNNS